MKKTILFLGLVMILTGCGSSAVTTETATEITTEIITEDTTTVVENEEAINEEDDWQEFEIRDGFVLKGGAYDAGNMIGLILNFTGSDVERQVYDFSVLYSVMEKRFDKFIIAITVKNENGYETGMITHIMSNSSENDTLPDSWEKLIKENELEEIAALVDKEDQDSDQKNMGTALGIILEMAQN